MSTVRPTSRLLNLAALLVAASLCACATRPPASDPAAVAAFDENNDRFEPLNRTMFKVDQAIDETIIHPVIWTYHTTVPDGARQALMRFMRNLGAPVTLVHDLLQGNVPAAGQTVARFVVNTTIGFFGFFDVGEEYGMPFHSEDFGQTLAVWGAPEGSYLYLPILGPSSVRDSIGFGVDSMAVDPISWYSRNPRNLQWVQWADFGLIYLTQKDDVIEALDELKRSSIDYYAALRSAYRQIRAKEVRNGAPPPLEDFGEAPE